MPIVQATYSLWTAIQMLVTKPGNVAGLYAQIIHKDCQKSLVNRAFPAQKNPFIARLIYEHFSSLHGLACEYQGKIQLFFCCCCCLIFQTETHNPEPFLTSLILTSLSFYPFLSLYLFCKCCLCSVFFSDKLRQKKSILDTQETPRFSINMYRVCF